MKIKGKIIFKKALVVDEKLLRNMDEIIVKYYNKTSYSVITISKDTIEFSSLDELLKYDNYGKMKIKKLHIDFGFNNDLRFEITPDIIKSYDATVTGNFEINDLNNCEDFKREIITVLSMNTQSSIINLFSKFSSMHLGILGIFVWFLSCFWSVFVNEGEHNITIYNICVYIGFFSAFVLFVCVLIEIIHKNLFNPLIYSIGNGVKEYERMKSLRINIFWGVIVAIAIPKVLSLGAKMIDFYFLQCK